MNTRKKTVIAGIACHGTLILLLLFIFGNSLLKPDISYSSSGAVTQMLTSSHGEAALVWEYIFRKLAHIVEFATLGAVIIFIKNFYVKTGKVISSWLPLFFVLAAGVVDEWLQVFSGRSSAVADIVLDFVSGVVGIAVTTGIIKFLKRFIKRRTLL